MDNIINYLFYPNTYDKNILITYINEINEENTLLNSNLDLDSRLLIPQLNYLDIINSNNFLEILILLVKINILLKKKK